MPRKSRAKPKSQEPVALADALEPIVKKHGIKTGDKIPAQLEPPEPPQEQKSEPVLESLPNASARVKAILAAQERPESHVAAVEASRPKFLPVPHGFSDTKKINNSGIRVNKNLDSQIVALQFAENMPLSRATEYDLMTKVQDAGFKYEAAPRQWQRPTQEGETLGNNIIDATRLADELSRERDGRGR